MHQRSEGHLAFTHEQSENQVRCSCYLPIQYTIPKRGEDTRKRTAVKCMFRGLQISYAFINRIRRKLYLCFPASSFLVVQLRPMKSLELIQTCRSVVC